MNKTIPKKTVADISVIKLINELILEAIKNRVSDIHIDPTRDSLQVRFRIDGMLHQSVVLPKELSPPVISRLKVLSNLRTDEHQKAQDGRFFFQKEDSSVDIRISIVPTYYGENAVLRLMITSEKRHTLKELGFEEKTASVIESSIKKSGGMILVTGPTGSGKTTTLYTLLSMLNTIDRSIVTVEDPIEYALAGLEQIQVNNQTGLSFANGLRSILRQDPDIIMVGEIRDRDTATIAINSALTGHLLFSTLHTNDSIGALARLHDLGIDTYLIASTLYLVIAQRLVRKICSSCKREKIWNKAEVESLNSPILIERTFYGNGCNHCYSSGFSGRLAINELLLVDAEIREIILSRVSEVQLRKLLKEKGFLSIQEDGWKKVLNGHTTPEELLRVIHE